MNIGRFAALAIIFMMVLSAFVAVPAYNASASYHDEDDDHGDDENHGDEDDHDHGDEDDHDHGDEDDHDHGDEDGDEDIELSDFKAIIIMHSLESWNVSITADFPADFSNEMRESIADFCENESPITEGTSDGTGTEITQTCFNVWFQELMGDDSDDGDHDGHHSEMVCYDIDSHTVDMTYDNEEDCVNDGYMWVPADSGPNGGDGHGGDHHGCPPGVSNETCAAVEACDYFEGGMNLTCMRVVYHMNIEMGEPQINDEMGWIGHVFAYEDQNITAEEFMVLFNESMMGDDDDHDHDHDEDDEHDHGDDDDDGARGGHGEDDDSDDGNGDDSDSDSFMMFVYMMDMMDNVTAWSNGTITAPVAANNIVSIVYEMDELGFFDDSGEDESYCYDYVNHERVDVGEDECVGDDLMWVEEDHDDHDDDHHGSEDAYCYDFVNHEVTGVDEDECVGEDLMWVEEDDDEDDEDDDEISYEEMMIVMAMADTNEDGNVSMDEFMSLIMMMDGEDIPEMAAADLQSLFNFADTDSSGAIGLDEFESFFTMVDDYDMDELYDVARLDSAFGLEIGNDDCMFMPVNAIGKLSDNQDKPMKCLFEFGIQVLGTIDATKESHVLFVPFPQTNWSLLLNLHEDYEYISCDNCEFDSQTQEMTGNGPVNITFGKKAEEEPLPECDYVVGLSDDGMAFNPDKLSIKVGETVCWQWQDASMAHNVVEVVDLDANKAVETGFSSGDAAVTVDFRHTFTEDNKVHYYVCEPHTQLGMVGQITVGDSSEDPVQQAIDDEEEVPSIGFMVGSLVLVGAAGLRRKINS